MANDVSGQSARDPELVAYLDGGLDASARAALEESLAHEPALRGRLAALKASERPFRAAFDVVLQQAPQARLAAILEQAEKTHDAGSRARAWHALSRRRAIAAGLALFVAGLSTGYGLGLLWPATGVVTEADKGTDASEAWRQVIASELALYTPETLRLMSEEGPPPASELEEIGRGIGLTLTPERLALPDLDLKQARLLAFRGVPFVQLIYLDKRHGPVAFCIFAGGEGKEPQETERREDMNLVYWVTQGLGFMLVGHAPAPELEALAQTVTTKFPAS